MGDAAFGMVGMDFETAVRSHLPILTIVLNNGLMGGYTEWMPDAVSRYGADRMGGRYADVATGARRARRARRSARPICAPRSSAASPRRAGQAALCEVATHEENAMAGSHLGGSVDPPI